MGKILESLLTDQLRVSSGAERRSPEHKALCEKCNELQDRLVETLNDKQKAILTELMETSFQECCCAEQLKYERGFHLGALIMAEIFFEKGTFL